MAYTLDDVQKYVDKEGLKDNILLYYKEGWGRYTGISYTLKGWLKVRKP